MRDPLFEPFETGPLRLENRVVMAPMTRGFSPGGTPEKDVAVYYRKRARGGVGLILTEGTAIDHDAALGYADIPRLYGEHALAGWRSVVEAVHAEGGKIASQLWHVGSYRKPGFDPEKNIPSVAPSAIAHPRRLEEGDASLPTPLDEKTIEGVANAYARSASAAKDVGFDGVEIHGAHGYLIDQFFWERTNRRKDRYGGSLKNRTAFAAETIASVRQAVGPDFPVLFRFSQWKLGLYDEKIAATPKDLETWLIPLAEAGVDLFHASTYRLDRPEFPGSALNLAGWAKKITGKPSISVGGVGVDRDFRQEKESSKETCASSLDAARGRLATDEFDLVAVGRALIGDPDWPEKIKEGRESDIRPYDRKLLGALV